MNPLLLKALSKAKQAGRYIKKHPAESAVLTGAGAVGALAGHEQGRFRENIRNMDAGFPNEKVNYPETWSGGGENIYGQQYGDQLGAGVTENRDGVDEMFTGFDTSDAMGMAKQNIEKWVKAGVEPDSAQWLGLIDTVYERESELHQDEKLSNQFSTMLEAMNVNPLDMDLGHHNQKRKKAGFDPIERIQQDAPEYNENVRR